MQQSDLHEILDVISIDFCVLAALLVGLGLVLLLLHFRNSQLKV